MSNLEWPDTQPTFPECDEALEQDALRFFGIKKFNTEKFESCDREDSESYCFSVDHFDMFKKCSETSNIYKEAMEMNDIEEKLGLMTNTSYMK